MYKGPQIMQIGGDNRHEGVLFSNNRVAEGLVIMLKYRLS
jgi:hypothetical protein